MRRLKILNNILKRVKAYQIIGAFLIFVLIAAGIFWVSEPGITNYWDALWYAYANLFTIGFGDIVVTTPIARIVSVILTIYATLVIALVTGVIVAFYQALISKHYAKSKEFILEKLTHLPDLSKDELKKISEKIKEIND